MKLQNVDGVQRKGSRSFLSRIAALWSKFSPQYVHQSDEYILFNRYRVIRDLVGHMCEVYLAYDQKLKRTVVIKINKKTGSSKHKKLFEREAEILAKLEHPKLPKVYDYDFLDSPRSQYLVMQYIQGKDLRKLLMEYDKPFPEERVRIWVKQIMSGLDYMHTSVQNEFGEHEPVCHRDIKPSNIIYTSNDRVVLIDFGLANLGEDFSTSDRSLVDFGTRGYAPPEQYEGKPVIQSDVYALGATIFHLLTYTNPREFSDRKQRLPRPSTLNASISHTMDEVVYRATELKPENRYQSIKEMRSALFGSNIVTIEEPETEPIADPFQDLPVIDSSLLIKIERDQPGILRWLTVVGVLCMLVLGISAGLIHLFGWQRSLSTYTNILNNVSDLVGEMLKVGSVSFSPSPATPVAFVATKTPIREPIETVSASDTSPTDPQIVSISNRCPKGMVLVDGYEYDFCIDQFEVSNVKYRECVTGSLLCDAIDNDLKKQKISGYSGASNYFDDKQYDLYPVFNITLAQAEKYCVTYAEWRGENTPWRLPTFEEWMFVYSKISNPENSWLDNLEGPIAIDDPRLDSVSMDEDAKAQKIVGLANNVAELVTLQNAPKDYIAAIVGGSFRNNKFPQAKTTGELSKYQPIIDENKDTIALDDVGFRCAAEPTS